MRTFRCPAYGSGKRNSACCACASELDRHSITPAAAIPRERTASRQREDMKRITFDRTVEKAAARCDDRHILLPLLALVSDRRRVRGGRQFRAPELSAGARVERAEPRVVRRTNKH